MSVGRTPKPGDLVILNHDFIDPDRIETLFSGDEDQVVVGLVTRIMEGNTFPEQLEVLVSGERYVYWADECSVVIAGRYHWHFPKPVL